MHGGAWISFSTKAREEIAADLQAEDPLKFKDSKKYKDRLSAAQKATEEKDALIVMRGKLKGMDLVAAAFEFKFMGGSMGSVVGERFVRGANIALEQHIPYVCFSASGGGANAGIPVLPVPDGQDLCRAQAHG